MKFYNLSKNDPLPPRPPPKKKKKEKKKVLAYVSSYFNTVLHGMTVSAVEQLQVMASKRQYKEAAAQLEVLYLLVDVLSSLL